MINVVTQESLTECDRQIAMLCGCMGYRRIYEIHMEMFKGKSVIDFTIDLPSENKNYEPLKTLEFLMTKDKEFNEKLRVGNPTSPDGDEYEGGFSKVVVITRYMRARKFYGISLGYVTIPFAPQPAFKKEDFEVLVTAEPAQTKKRKIK